MSNNPVFFSWNSDEEGGDLDNIMRNSDEPLQLHASSISMAASSAFQPLASQSISLIDAVQPTPMAASSALQPLASQSSLIGVVQPTPMAASSALQPLASQSSLIGVVQPTPMAASSAFQPFSSQSSLTGVVQPTPMAASSAFQPFASQSSLIGVVQPTPMAASSAFQPFASQSSLIGVVQPTPMAASSAFQPLASQSPLVGVVQPTSMASSSAFQPLASDHPFHCTTTSSPVFGVWSDVVTQPPPRPPPPLPPLPPQSFQTCREQDQLQELLLFLQRQQQQQQQQQQMQDFVYPMAGQSVMPFPARLEQGEPSSHHVENAPLMNLECQAPSQVATPGISIGKNQSDSGEHNKRLKSVKEAHTISEKRRREKFKGKLKELEELLPKSDKRDTASILDESIKLMKLLQIQVQWMQEQYMLSAMRAFSQSHNATYPSPMNPAQMMGHPRTNMVGMVPYHPMLQYPVAATMMPRVQMFPMLPPPPPVSFSTTPSSTVTAPRVPIAPRGRPLTPVVTNVPEEGDEAGDKDGKLAPSSSRGCKRDRK